MIFDKLSSDDQVSAGSVVVVGTRVNFQTIALASLAGASTNDIRRDYGVDEESIAQCVTLFEYCRRNIDDFRS
jgi:uncharacterized protein (DUF433 family)